MRCTDTQAMRMSMVELNASAQCTGVQAGGGIGASRRSCSEQAAGIRLRSSSRHLARGIG